jgi:hypothetical protein
MKSTRYQDRWRHEIFITCKKNVPDQNQVAEMKTIHDLSPLLNIQDLKSHLGRVGTDLIVKPSNRFLNQINGLFTTRKYKKNEIITFYDGKIIPYTRDLPPTLLSHARTLISFQWILLGNIHPTLFTNLNSNDQSLIFGLGGGAFINHSSFDPNVMFFHIDNVDNETKYLGTPNPNQRIICIVALEDIEEDKEIFIDYGTQFWSKEEPKICSLKINKKKRFKLNYKQKKIRKTYILTKNRIYL